MEMNEENDNTNVVGAEAIIDDDELPGISVDRKELDLSEKKNSILEDSENVAGVPPFTLENDNPDEPTFSVTTRSGHSVRTPRNWLLSPRRELNSAK